VVFLRATALVRWPPPLPWLRWLHAAGVEMMSKLREL